MQHPRLRLSYRAKLQLAFLGLALSAILLTGWQALYGAEAALRQATLDRLIAIRDTRSRELERYFHDLENHVLALASDESTIRAVEEFSAAWPALSAATEAQNRELSEFYASQRLPAELLPSDPRARSLQHQFLVLNPHPQSARDRLLTVPGPYGAVHRRYHPTLHRYQSAFGFYDILLLDAAAGRVLYSVLKETDFGAEVNHPALRESGLADVYRRAMRLEEPETFATRDFSRYTVSQGAPAAFVAAPVWRSGVKTGVLAIQVSIAEIDRVMSGELQGLGDTGQAYLVGPDGLLRSDLRFRTDAAGTGILAVQVAPDITALRQAPAGVETGVPSVGGRQQQGIRVLRSHRKPRITGLDWGLIVEIDESEAFAPLRELRRRIVLSGGLLAGGFLLVAAFVARSVTRPVLALQESVRRVATRDFRARVEADANDELGELSAAFNRMAQELEKTTVSRDELERLAGKLIHAQEEERRKIARELHDDVTQRMAAVAIEAGLLAADSTDNTAVLRDGIQQIRKKIANLTTDIHGLSRSLHPAMLEDLGLAASVEAECRASFERGGPPVDCDVSGSFEDLSRDVRLTLLRIVQEGLRNVQRHAAAEQVHVRLIREREVVVLRISDDGRGFDRKDPNWHAGLGLASMEERVRLVSGEWAIQSAPGQGTNLQVRIPIA